MVCCVVRKRSLSEGLEELFPEDSYQRQRVGFCSNKIHISRLFAFLAEGRICCNHTQNDCVDITNFARIKVKSNYTEPEAM